MADLLRDINEQLGDAQLPQATVLVINEIDRRLEMLERAVDAITQHPALSIPPIME
jgi:hypothetical protein